MSLPVKTHQVDGDSAREIYEKMDQLEQVLVRTTGLKPVGAILIREDGAITFLIHPQWQADPTLMWATIAGIRKACDLHEREFVKRKLQ